MEMNVEKPKVMGVSKHPSPVQIMIDDKELVYVDDFNSLDSKNGKAIPIQAWTGPEGSGRLRLPDFKTVGT